MRRLGRVDQLAVEVAQQQAANCHCRDTNHLKEVLHDKMQQVDGIERTETMISLEESLDRNLNLS